MLYYTDEFTPTSTAMPLSFVDHPPLGPGTHIAVSVALQIFPELVTATPMEIDRILSKLPNSDTTIYNALRAVEMAIHTTM